MAFNGCAKRVASIVKEFILYHEVASIAVHSSSVSSVKYTCVFERYMDMKYCSLLVPCVFYFVIYMAAKISFLSVIMYIYNSEFFKT